MTVFGAPAAVEQTFFWYNIIVMLQSFYTQAQYLQAALVNKTSRQNQLLSYYGQWRTGMA